MFGFCFDYQAKSADRYKSRKTKRHNIKWRVSHDEQSAASAKDKKENRHGRKTNYEHKSALQFRLMRTKKRRRKLEQQQEGCGGKH